MKPLGCLGIGLSLVSGCIFLAIVAELYYFFWWKKRRINRDIEENYTIPAKELPYLFCLKKPSFLTSTALSPQEICIQVNGATHSDDEQLQLHSNTSKDLLLMPFGDDTVDAELMCLAGPPRSLFTIEEETQEELESEDVGNRKSGRGKSLRDLLLSAETPTLTPLPSPPLFSPPLTPMACCKQNGFNPLFEPSKEDTLAWMCSSPPPTLKFLKDAEEKLYRKTLMEEALKVYISRRHFENKEKKEASVAPLPLPIAASPPEVVISMNRGDKAHQINSSSSQLIPFPSSPLTIKQVNEKPC